MTIGIIELKNVVEFLQLLVDQYESRDVLSCTNIKGIPGSMNALFHGPHQQSNKKNWGKAGDLRKPPLEKDLVEGHHAAAGRKTPLHLLCYPGADGGRAANSLPLGIRMKTHCR